MGEDVGWGLSHINPQPPTAMKNPYIILDLKQLQKMTRIARRLVKERQARETRLNWPVTKSDMMCFCLDAEFADPVKHPGKLNHVTLRVCGDKENKFDI